MRLNTIRWQLPISYALIALGTTVVLGAVMLLALRAYYVGLEEEYLDRNIDTISNSVSELLASGASLPIIQAQIASYSFLTQVQIQLLDAHDNLLVDSGVPLGQNMLSISAEPPDDTIGANSEMPVDANNPIFRLMADENDLVDLSAFRTSLTVPMTLSVDDPASETQNFITPVITLDFRSADEQLDESNGEFTSVLAATSTLYGFGLSNEISADTARSDRFATRQIVNEDGRVIGNILITNGPAYGRQFVNQVALIWLFAGVVTVSIAIGLGWLISQRINRPLSTLTTATTRMAHGDLTVRVDMERNDEFGILGTAFDNMASQIERTVGTLKRFIADAAHELHTPLTALHTNLELAIEESAIDKQHQYLYHANRQIERLETVTDELLDLSRLDSGVVNEKYQRIYFGQMVQELSEIYASRSEQAEVEFLLDLPQHEMTIYGQKEQIKSVVRNLLDNAIKFTPAGKRVYVVVRDVDDRILLEICDQGIGIPANEINEVYSRFYRGQNATEYTGSGLGLAIVKSIVEAHQGEISISSEGLGQGTCVRISFPRLGKGRNILRSA